MMELIRQWLLGMVCAAMAAALAQSLAPEGGPKRICKLAGALVLLLAAVSPILRLDERALSHWKRTARILSEVILRPWRRRTICSIKPS